MLRVLREWILARSAPASPLARACALHLLCRDAGKPWDDVRGFVSEVMLATVRMRMVGLRMSARSAP